MSACFFDLDGTLFDTRRDLAATVNHTRAELGLEPLPVESVLVHVGQGAKHLLAHAIPERADDVERLWSIFRRHYAEHMLETCAPYPGVFETLRALAARGWRFGVNTAKPAFATRAILEHFGLTDLFGAAVVAGGDCDEMKPSAKPLRLCAERLGHTLAPTDWMVGDNWTDLACAANAGIRGAFCAFGFGCRADAPCDAQLTTFSDLVRVLGERKTSGVLV